MIRVMLVDDHHIVREGVKSVLSTVEDIVIVGEAPNGKEALDILEDTQPNVVLMDIHMPDMGGIKAGIQIKDKHPGIKIIFLTTFADEDIIITGMNARADGFLYKEIDGSLLVQSIRNVYHNQIVIAGEAANILAKRIRDTSFSKHDILKRKLEGRHIELTYREIDIACLLMQERTNHYIAKQLHLSEGTIKNYISAIYNKLNIHNRSKVVAYLHNLSTDHDVL